jgi:hypothetical protein
MISTSTDEITLLFGCYGLLAVVFFFAVLTLPAQLNSSCDDIAGLLRRGDEEDWELYGGRAKLIEYIQSNQLQYTVYKFAITYTWLLGFGSGVASTLILTAITYVLG